MISNNNQLENKNRKPQIYRIRDKVLVRYKEENNYEDPYVGPYPITQVWTNGNVKIHWEAENITIHWGAIQECINIIWIELYNQSS